MHFCQTTRLITKFGTLTMNLLQAVMIVFFQIYFSFFLQNRCKVFILSSIQIFKDRNNCNARQVERTITDNYGR